MIEELHKTQVDLDGLLDVLGKNLYSTPAIAIRELIQNAHDACVRYRIEADSTRECSIRVGANNGKGEITIADNGSGLTYDEVVKYLATIGSGYTRLLRSGTQNEDFVGYFGLGFLSAYVVADKVEVHTTSYQTPDQTWRFSTSSGKRFAVSAVAQREVGTSVTLHLRADYRDLSVAETLRRLIERYCCLLKVPIYLNAGEKPVNGLDVPWRHEPTVSPLQRRKRRLQFAAIFEHTFEPICTLVVPEDNPWALKGLLWVQDRGGYATSDYRNLSVFVRNMFITNECRDLLPVWAGFVGGVIETAALAPTASREDVQKDERFREICAFLAETLINGLREIATGEASTWRRILVRHNQALLGAALSDDRLFEVMQDDLKIPTSMGDMTVPAYLKRSGGKIYIRDSNKSSQEELLFRAELKPLVHGYLYAAAGFCRKYGSTHGVEVNVLGTQAGGKLFAPAAVTPQVADKLARLLRRNNEELICTSFESQHVPLIVVDDADVLLKRRIEQDDADKRIGSAALSLARLHTRSIAAEVERRVYVNLASPLIDRLLELDNVAAAHLAVAIRAYMESLSHEVDAPESTFAEQLARFGAALLALASGR